MSVLIESHFEACMRSYGFLGLVVFFFCVFRLFSFFLVDLRDLKINLLLSINCLNNHLQMMYPQGE